jgi:hypothetical protein
MRVKLGLATVTAALAALAACGSPSAHGKEGDAEAAIAAFEKKVPLPDATRTLGGYERYYAVSDDRIEAVYLSSPSGSGGSRVVEQRELPQAKEGGCSVVTIVFDRTSNRFHRVLCNEVRLTQLQPAVEMPGTPAPRGERG